MAWLFLTFLAVLNRASYGVFSKVLSNRVPMSPASQSLILRTVCIPIAAGVVTLIFAIVLAQYDGKRQMNAGSSTSLPQPDALLHFRFRVHNCPPH